MSTEPTASTSSLLAREELSLKHLTILQDLFDNNPFTPQTAAHKLAKVTILSPKIKRKEFERKKFEYEYDVELLFENVLAALHKCPHRVRDVADLIVCLSELPPVVAKPSASASVSGGEQGLVVVEDEGYTLVWDDGVKHLGGAFHREWDREFFFIFGSTYLTS